MAAPETPYFNTIDSSNPGTSTPQPDASDSDLRFGPRRCLGLSEGSGRDHSAAWHQQISPRRLFQGLRRCRAFRPIRDGRSHHRLTRLDEEFQV